MPRSRIQIEPHLDYSELTRCYRSCHDGKERIRWLIIRLLSRPNNPMKVEQVAEITGISADGIRKIARRYNLTGPDGLKNGHSRHPGGKSGVAELRYDKWGQGMFWLPDLPRQERD